MHLTLSHKVNGAIIITFLLIAAIFSAIQLPLLQHRLQTAVNNIEVLLQTLVERDLEQLANELFDTRLKAIKIRLKQMRKVDGILAIAVFDDSGQRLVADGADCTAHHIAPNELKNIRRHSQIQRKRWQGQAVLLFSHEIDFLGEHSGFIRIHYSLENVEHDRSLSLLIFISLLVTILLVMLTVLNLILSKAILDPIRYLQNATRFIARGNLDEAIDMPRKDELGALAKSFANMRDSIKEKINDLARSNEKLQQNEEKFRALVESSGDWIWEVNSEDIYTYASPQIESILGYKPEEIVGKTPFDLMPPENVDRIARIYYELSKSGKPISSIENVNLHKDGRRIVLETSGTPVLDETGKVTGYRGIDRDITRRKFEQKRLEKLNRIKENLLSTGRLNEKTKLLTDGVVDVLGADFARIWLIRPGDLCDSGCKHARVTQGPYACRERERCLHLIASSGRYTHTDGEGHRRVPFGCCQFGLIAAADEHGFLTNDVTHHPYVRNHEWARQLGLVSFAGHRLLSHNRTTMGVLALFSKHTLSPTDEALLRAFAGIASEVILAAQAEEELRHLRNYLSNILDSMPSVLVGVDADDRITQWNTQAQKITGVPAGEAMGQSLARMFPRLKDEIERVHEAMQTRKVKIDSKRVHRENGETHYEDITIYPLNANGVEGAVIRIDDVTEKVRLEEMMIQSEKMLSVGGLAAGMAHEINNPLAGMMQTANVMSHRLGDESDMPANRKAAKAAGTTMEIIRNFMASRGILRMLTTINESGRRVADIVENMLSFSRKSDSAALAHNLPDLMDKTLELAATDYDLKKHYDFKMIAISKEYEADLPAVPCEGAKIQQVLLNILKNGAEAMQEAQTVKPQFIFRAFFEKERKMICMEIEDNGPGMDETIRRRVFEPFYTTKPVGLGTGLGLSVSYFIITENHGGEMTVESQPASGSKFIIRLPLERENR